MKTPTTAGFNPADGPPVRPRPSRRFSERQGFMRRKVLLLIGIAFALLLAGCGSDETATETSSATTAVLATSEPTAVPATPEPTEVPATPEPIAVPATPEPTALPVNVPAAVESEADPEPDATIKNDGVAEFVVMANAICRAGTADIDAAYDALFPLDPDSTQQEADQKFFDAIVSSLWGQFADLRALDGPRGVQDEVDSILDESAQVLDQISAGGPETFFGSPINPFGDVNARLRTIDLNTCADG